MVLAGSVLSFAGIGIVVFRVPFLGVTPLTPDLSALITVLWVVGMANAINLIDGLDGLAAGIVGIAAATFFFYALRLSDEHVILTDNPGALVAVITAGLCLGFLPHNFNPARIFMGDAGALMLGLLMAVSTTMVGGRNEQAVLGPVVLLLRPDLHPARHPRSPLARRPLRHRAPNRPQTRGRHRRQRPPPPSPDAHRPRPPPQCAHLVGVDRCCCRASSSTRPTTTDGVTRWCRRVSPRSVCCSTRYCTRISARDEPNAETDRTAGAGQDQRRPHRPQPPHRQLSSPTESTNPAISDTVTSCR